MKEFKQLTKSTVMVLFAVLAAVSFTSCGDDDDDEEDLGAIVGTWKGSIYDEDYGADEDDVTVMTFSTDGKMTAKGGELGDPDSAWAFSGSYKLMAHGNASNGEGVYLISIGGYFSNDDEYYDDDIEFRSCHIHDNVLDIFFDGSYYRLYRQ